MINLTIIEKFLKYPYSFEKTLAPLLIFFLIFYGGYTAPKLPDLIVSLFENPTFRIFILSLIVYKGNQNLPRVMNGLGVAIVTTSKGVMTDIKARDAGIGGEILCYVS